MGKTSTICFEIRGQTQVSRHPMTPIWPCQNRSVFVINFMFARERPPINQRKCAPKWRGRGLPWQFPVSSTTGPRRIELSLGIAVGIGNRCS